jgi:hypothetical protein
MSQLTTVNPTGVLGTNLAGGVVNEAAVIGIVGPKGAQFLENAGNFPQGMITVRHTGSAADCRLDNPRRKDARSASRVSRGSISSSKPMCSAER